MQFGRHIRITTVQECWHQNKKMLSNMLWKDTICWLQGSVAPEKRFCWSNFLLAIYIPIWNANISLWGGNLKFHPFANIRRLKPLQKYQIIFFTSKKYIVLPHINIKKYRVIPNKCFWPPKNTKILNSDPRN